MRPLLLTVLVACSSSSKPAQVPAPTTIVVHDELLKKDILEQKMNEGEHYIAEGCAVLSVDGLAVVRCPKFAVRFDCIDHLERPVGVLIGGVEYTLTCR